MTSRSVSLRTNGQLPPNSPTSPSSPGMSRYPDEYDIVSPAVRADQERQIVTLQRQNREQADRERALVRRENTLHQQAQALAAREETIKQDQLALVRREEDLRKRAGELDRQRHVLENERLVLAQEKEHTRRMEEQRRARRTNSEAFLEDTFPALGIPDIVRHLGNSSLRIRRHCMATLGPFSDYKYAQQHQRDFDALILALLPTTIPLIRLNKDDVIEFVSSLLGERHIALSLSKSQQCPQLFEILMIQNDVMSSIARDALTIILKGDITCRRPLQVTLSRLLLHETQPVVLEFAHLALPALVQDAIADGQYQAAVFYANHPSETVRTSVYQPVSRAVNSAVAVRRGLVHAGLIVGGHGLISSSNPPVDLLTFMASVLPNLATEIALEDQTPLLLNMLLYKDQGLQSACIISLRAIRKVDANAREKLRLALDPYIWHSDAMDERVRAFTLESLQQIATDLLSAGRLTEILTYLDLPDSSMRELFLTVILKLAQESPEQQKKLLDAGLLSKIQPYLALPDIPSDVMTFTVRALPAFAIQICKSGGTNILVELVLHRDMTLSGSATNALRRILHSDRRCRQALQYSLETHLIAPPPKILEFMIETLPLIANDMMTDNRHSEILVFLSHENAAIRQAVMPVVLQLSQTSAGQQKQLAGVGIMTVLSPQLSSPRPPEDIIQFGGTLLLLIAVYLAEGGFAPQLIDLLGNPPTRQLAADCLRKVASAGEKAQQGLVSADILPRLVQHLQIVQDPVIVGLLGDLLPMICLLCCRRGQSGLIIHLASSSNPTLKGRALAAVRTIVASSPADRGALREAYLPQLDSQEEHILDIADIALQPMTNDILNTGELNAVLEFAMHAEPRIRCPAYGPLRDAIRENQGTRQTLVELGFFQILIKFCSSPVRDRVEFASSVIPLMGMDACRAGLLRNILELFNVDEKLARQALYISLVQIARGTPVDQHMLIDANFLTILSASLRNPHQGEPEFCEQILPLLSQRIAEIDDACSIALHLLVNGHPTVRSSATRTLDNILGGAPTDRTILGRTILAQLDSSPPPNIIQYCAKALTSTICGDYIREGTYQVLFDLLSHRSPEIRIAVESQLQLALRNDGTAERLASAGLFQIILSSLPNAPQDVLTFAAEQAIPSLGPFLVESEADTSSLISLLSHGQKPIRQAAAASLRKAASASAVHRQRLVKADLVERLISSLGVGDPSLVDLACGLLPVLAVEIAQAGLCDTLLDLLNHEILAIRRAARQTLDVVLRDDDVRVQLVRPLFARSGQLKESNSAFFAEAITALSDAILLIGDEKRLLALMWHEIPAVSEAAFTSVRGLIINGTIADRRRLLEGQLFNQLLQMLNNSRLRSTAIIFALDVMPLLTPLMVETGRFDQLIQLFVDEEPQIVSSVDDTIRSVCVNPAVNIQLVQQDVIPRLMILLDTRGDERVLDLVCFVMKSLAVQLVDFGKSSILVTALTRREAKLRAAAVSGIETASNQGGNTVQSTLILTDGFLSGLLSIITIDRGKYDVLKAVCRSLANIATADINRSKEISASGLIPSLVELARTPDEGMQVASLEAIFAVTATAFGDKTPIIRTGIVNVLLRYLVEPPSARVAQLSLKIMNSIASLPPHRAEIGKAGILGALAHYLLPKDDTIPLARANQVTALKICQNIASESDRERKSIFEAGLILPLLHLTQGNRAEVVCLACGTIEALARTGTFKQELLNAEADKYLRRITSMMHKSTLAAGEDRKSANKSAKQALDMMETGILRGLSRRLSRSSPSTRKLHARAHSGNLMSPTIREE
ncbi:ARM repeat-containing protein [Dacryopinax primogenitus]|uniref:ARM repeat-containing protein n=1 Tax=Dacryopinax primogenitus (strain DJM 731) TaxID=1858805 RepID=M5FZ13_DACPD|nr:ARM repeat-containing protein [Dacryopinax primogenitus]EJU01744.1 ARM repeat-containing protein [Dacryopinax primogenitus]